MHLWWARRPLARAERSSLGTLDRRPRRRDRVAGDHGRASPRPREFEASNDAGRIEPLRAATPRKLRRTRPEGARLLRRWRRDPARGTATRLRHDCARSQPGRAPHRTLRPGVPAALRADGRNRRQRARRGISTLGWLGPRTSRGPTGAQRSSSDERRHGPPSTSGRRTMHCLNPACGMQIPLVTSRWLANSSRRQAWLRFNEARSRDRVTVVDGCTAGRGRSQARHKQSELRHVSSMRHRI